MEDSAQKDQLFSPRGITRRECIAAGPVALASATLLKVDPPPSNRLAADRNRPRYHLMPPANWMNDPNGPFQWRRRYHLFYQYAPVVSNTGTKYWGHAVSSDLVHWKNLGIALAPTPGGPDQNGCWTGSAVVANGVPTLIYTGATWPASAATERAARAAGLIPERQMVAVSADPNDPEQKKWSKIPRNPVLAAPPPGIKAVGWRDPAVWGESDGWYMVIGSGELGIGGMALLYRSQDLRDWTYLHPLAVAERRASQQGPVGPGADMWECPDFFFLDGKPILLVARGNSYLRGTYSGHRFQQTSGGQIDFGAAYAQKTMEDEKGRRIWWGWIHEKRSMRAQAAAGWAGVMSLPKLLTLRSDGSLGIAPVPELAILRRGAARLADQAIMPNGPLLLNQFEGDCTEIEADIEFGDSRQAGLRVRSTADGGEQTLIGYDRDSETLFSDTTRSSLDAETLSGGFPRAGRGVQSGILKLEADEPLRLRVYLDASVIETFANGRASISDRVYPVSAASLGIGLFSRGGTAHLRSMTVWQLAPISTDRLTSGAELYRV
jgi:beta-fructofuranosidase